MRESKWEAMTLKQKVHDWSSRNQYKIILGSWVLSMGVAGTIIMRDKYVFFAIHSIMRADNPSLDTKHHPKR